MGEDIESQSTEYYFLRVKLTKPQHRCLTYLSKALRKSKQAITKLALELLAEIVVELVNTDVTPEALARIYATVRAEAMRRAIGELRNLVREAQWPKEEDHQPPGRRIGGVRG